MMITLNAQATGLAAPFAPRLAHSVAAGVRTTALS
ncbi:hypothetical protein JOF42_002092 [Microbacterium phyllosphaerae]|uniref:Uncharacterized protein n=1 Tax=Microbacterium phyllosphaerae TaxID=124798 RepID=A0ABS4WQV2_9MICO|nr:hypothetical protein [Microbacterium phyllosphaerae]